MSKIDKDGNITITSPSNHLKEGVTNKSLREPRQADYSSRSSSSRVGIFGIIILILFVIVFSNYIRTGTFVNFSFKSLIDILANAPNVDVSWSIFDINLGDWGPFNFLRDFVNLNLDIIEILSSLFGMLWQGLNFLFYFIRVLLF